MIAAVFGGSFNPPHLSHERAVEAVVASGQVDAVWIVPTAVHPFGKPLAPFAERLGLCRLAFGRFGREVEVLDLEAELPGPSYTVRTLEELHRRHPGITLALVVGSDVLADRSHWKDFSRIETLARLIIVPREGYTADDSRTLDIAPLAPISSTEIRERLRRGEAVGHLVSAAVERAIRERGLYQPSGLAAQKT